MTRRRRQIYATLAAALALGSSGCTGWPESTGGGLAERRAPTDPTMIARAERLRMLERDGARSAASMEMAEASKLMVSAQRAAGAGEFGRAAREAAALDAILDLAETRSAAMKAGGKS